METKFKILIIGFLCFVLLIFVTFTIFPIGSDCNEPTQGWTIQTLKEYVDQRFEQIERSTALANAALEKRLDNTNEWRGSYDDLARTKIARTEWEAGQASDQKQLTELKERLDKYENLKSGGSNTIAYLMAGISFLIAMIALGRNFIASIYRGKQEVK